MLTITSGARLYALRELARRAGVEPSFFAEWRVQLEHERTLVWVGHNNAIEFPHGSVEFWRDVNNGNFRVEHATWSYPPAPGLSEQIPHFVVPFADREIRGPLFRMMDEHHAECSVDL